MAGLVNILFLSPYFYVRTFIVMYVAIKCIPNIHLKRMHISRNSGVQLVQAEVQEQLISYIFALSYLASCSRTSNELSYCARAGAITLALILHCLA